MHVIVFDRSKTKGKLMTHSTHASNATMLLALSIAGGALAGSGCSSSGAAAEPPSVQQRANATIAEAKVEAVKAATQARRKADEAQQEASRESAEANQEAQGEGAQAQVNANVEVRKLNRKTAKETTGLREWSQRKMDALDNAIDAARAKEQTAAPELRAAFETRMKAVEIRRDAMRANVADIQTQSGKDMAAFKERFDTESNQLEDRVQKLSVALVP
jgi:hypothetical protein